MKHSYQPRMLAAGFIAVALSATTLLASGFTVVKNVNTDAPAEKFVIFDKSQPADHLVFVDTTSCKMARLDDGSIESRVTGNDTVRPTIEWKPSDSLPATFDATSLGYLILTFRVEGDTKQTDPNGKVRVVRGDNLWLGLALYDEDGTRLGILNTADFTDDQKTPAETTTIRVPLSLLAKPKDPNADPRHVKGVGFYWDKTRPNIDRDFRIIIEKIVLAD
jgi:hypothetical protein